MDQNAVTLGNFSKSGQRFKIDGFALDSFTENEEKWYKPSLCTYMAMAYIFILALVVFQYFDNIMPYLVFR